MRAYGEFLVRPSNCSRRHGVERGFHAVSSVDPQL
jgi:hypothetical protein